MRSHHFLQLRCSPRLRPLSGQRVSRGDGRTGTVSRIRHSRRIPMPCCDARFFGRAPCAIGLWRAGRMARTGGTPVSSTAARRGGLIHPCRRQFHRAYYALWATASFRISSRSFSGTCPNALRLRILAVEYRSAVFPYFNRSDLAASTTTCCLRSDFGDLAALGALFSSSIQY